jgi:thiamine kinase-like enzyme
MGAEAWDEGVAEAIAAVPAWTGLDAHLTPITAGITNRNYRVDIGGESFVLRLSGKNTELLGIDRAAERAAGAAAAAAGVGPEIFAYLPQQEALVTRFVGGDHVTEEDLRTERVLGAVVRSAKAIHACAPVPSTFPVFEIVTDYARIAREHGVRIPEAYDDAHAFAGWIKGAFDQAPMPLTTCHDDLLNANFLLEGDHCWIVDYEYAGMGDLFFDLGNLSINNNFDEPAQESLLRLYFGEVGDVHRARLALMRVVSDFREAMWGVVQQALSTLDFDYVAYADRHFARLLAGAQDDRFGAWLEAAKAPVPA